MCRSLPHGAVTVKTVTATSEHKIHTPGQEPVRWSERSALGARRGISWWAAGVLPFVLTAVCVLVDLLRGAGAGMFFVAGYFLGCLLAVVLVRRGNLFGPMVQPPLIAAVTLPLLVLLTGTGFDWGGGRRNILLAVATPLINSFPVMATTTVLVLVVGVLRIRVLEPDSANTSTATGTRSAGASTTSERRDSTGTRKRGTAAGRAGERRSGRDGTSARNTDGAAKRDSGEGGKARPGRGTTRGATRSGEDTPRPRTGTSGAAGGRKEPGAQPPTSGRGSPEAPRGARPGEKRAAPPGRSAPGSAGKPTQQPGRSEPPGRPRRPRRGDR